MAYDTLSTGIFSSSLRNSDDLLVFLKDCVCYAEICQFMMKFICMLYFLL